MDNQTRWSLVELDNYINALETFKSRVERSCTNLETGMNSCQRHMLDEVSQKALQKGKKVAADIRECLKPVQMELVKLYEIKRQLTRTSEFEIR